jgi:site-specific recombinase XerD
MKSKEQKRFETMYEKHLMMLENHGMRPATIDSYCRAVRRVSEALDSCPDSLTPDQMKEYFNKLTKRYSWSTIKCDLSGLKFFWEYSLEKDWDWVTIVKPPQVKTLPDVLTIGEVETLLNTVRKIRYRVFLFVTYSMGLRLGETLNLRVADIDSKTMRVHIRDGKGGKDRFVPLPQSTLEALRFFWKTHKNPTLIFPNQNGTAETIRSADTPMDREGAQQAMKAAVKDCRIKKAVSVHSLRHRWFLGHVFWP